MDSLGVELKCDLGCERNESKYPLLQKKQPGYMPGCSCFILFVSQPTSASLVLAVFGILAVLAIGAVLRVLAVFRILAILRVLAVLRCAIKTQIFLRNFSGFQHTDRSLCVSNVLDEIQLLEELDSFLAWLA
jgi:hypothetical protein